MKKINKKGFTLVELMAVLIILIIIVVIAINRVNETSEKAKNNAIISNAGIYIKAVNDALDLNSLSTVTSLEGSFPIQVFDSLDVRISGKKPDGGYLTLTDDEVTGGCLEYEGSYVNYRKGKIKKPRKGTCSFTLEYAYEFTGSVQEFTVPFTAIYKVELWGAHGGNNGATQGKGAYTSGEIVLNAGEKLYVYVGGAGNATRPSVSEYKAGGYNGGGYTNGQSCCDRTYGTGGGATDIRLVGGEWNDAVSLASRIMVAGGGGGGFNGGSGGAAGGLNGQNGLSNNGWGPGPGATQTSGGINTAQVAASGSFGKGGEGGNNGASTGGGGGYYGGAGSYHIDAAGGGSSYISGHIGCVAIVSKENITPKDGCDNGTTDYSCSVHYSGKVFTDTVMKSGNESMPTFDGKSTMVGSNINGYAKITFVELVNNNVKKYNYTGTEQTFVAQKAGTYKIELWGAQGGINMNTSWPNDKIGKGSYVSGKIHLEKNETLHIYVGEAGRYGTTSIPATFNGGGSDTTNAASCTNSGTSGGGATDVRLIGGNWDSEISLASRIMVAAGSGGNIGYSSGSDGGTLQSFTGTFNSAGTAHRRSTQSPATQTHGGVSDNKQTDYTAGLANEDGSFGKGGRGAGGECMGAGGGGGYYGGAGSYNVGGGSGGSSYISGHKGCVAITSQDSITPKAGCVDGTTDKSCSIHYSLKEFTDTVMKAGNEKMPSHDGKGTMTGNEGNGYAVITFIE